LLRVVDVLALARTVAMAECREDRERAHDAVVGIGERVLDRNRRAVDVAGEAVEPGRAREAEPVVRISFNGP
jgi:hypothetical protein